LRHPTHQAKFCGRDEYCVIVHAGSAISVFQLALVGPSIFQERNCCLCCCCCVVVVNWPWSALPYSRKELLSLLSLLCCCCLFKACCISNGDHHENRSVDVFDIPHLHSLSDWCSLHGRCLENITRIHISKSRISSLHGWIPSGKTTGGWGWPEE
jgi:hypothetical protein